MKDQNEQTKLHSGEISKPESNAPTRGMTRRSALGLLGSGGLALMTGTVAVAAGQVAQAGRSRNPQQITALVFDAYGTLFDVFLPVFNRAKEIYGPTYNDLLYETLIQVWRLKQLEYSWLRTLIREYRDFYSCTISSLDFALRSVGIDPDDDPAKRDALASRYLTLDAYPEALEVLTTLKSRGFKLAILSNGSRDMLQQVVVANNMQNVLDEWISVDEVGVFKPDPKVYPLAERELRVPRKQILFVSSNSFDVLGAKNYGLTTAWIRRGGTLPQVATPMPNAIAPSTLFGILRGRQEFQEETTLLPDYVVLPPSATPTEGLRGLLTLPPLEV